MIRPAMKRGVKQWLVGSAVLLLLLLAVRAHARAGGGGHFSGGGHSSGGGGFGHSSGGFGGHYSGGGSSSGGSTLDLIIFVIVVIIIVYAVLESQKAQTFRSGGVAIDSSTAMTLAERLRQADPAFDAERFYARVSQAFLAIQSAWSGHDLRAIQLFVSDGVMERFGLQIREQQALGYRDQMDQVRVRQVRLANVTQGDVFETATLRVDASAIDYEASLADGKFLRGSRGPEDFTEFWTFIRRRGTASVAGDGLIEGRCPNCGAEIHINQNAACEHCGALLRSGRYDWVLCEITQASEWRPRDERPVPGYAALRAIDAGLALDDLEDRASVMFWRRAESDRTNNPAALRKVALESYMSERAAQRGDDSTQWNWFGDVGVGSVDTLALVGRADFDRAVVRIAWSGTRFTQGNDGKTHRGDETSVIREIFILARRSGVRSDPDKGITSAHCPACGAPVSSGLGNGCESCGRVLNDGSAGWVLEAIESGASEHVAALLREARASAAQNESDVVSTASAAPPSSRGLLIWAIKLSVADGEIDPRERQWIERLAAKAAVSAGEIESLIAAAQAGRLDAPEPTDRDEVIAWLTAMIDVALADGRLTSGEAALLKSIADRAGMGEVDLRLLIKKEQARLFAAARDAGRK